MSRVLIEELAGTPTWKRPFEIVERKGLGHPDSICDAIMDEAARTLVRRYVKELGAPRHFNLDKGLLAAGATRPAFGGGRIDAPMRLVFGDRAVYEAEGHIIPVAEILEETARSWFRSHLRFVDPDRHLICQNEVRAGSPELTGIFASETPSANDTSAAVAFAPLSPTERLVLEAERFLNAPETKDAFPESGEDVKVMGVRENDTVRLTVAVAFVDRFIDSERTYYSRKQALTSALTEHLQTKLDASSELSDLEVRLNALDAPGRGADACYLTVTGTSAEGADSGQVGRGNLLCGLFSSRRPSSNEAVSGKNPQSHVGKIYNVLAQRVADGLVEIDAVEEATVHLVSQIGSPLDAPQLAAVQLVLAEGASLGDVEPQVNDVLEKYLAGVSGLADDWLRGRG